MMNGRPFKNINIIYIGEFNYTHFFFLKINIINMYHTYLTLTINARFITIFSIHFIIIDDSLSILIYLILGESTSIAYFFKQFSSSSIFHDYGQMSWCQTHLQQKCPFVLNMINHFVEYILATKARARNKQRNVLKKTDVLEFSHLIKYRKI